MYMYIYSRTFDVIIDYTDKDFVETKFNSSKSDFHFKSIEGAFRERSAHRP